MPVVNNTKHSYLTVAARLIILLGACRTEISQPAQIHRQNSRGSLLHWPFTESCLESLDLCVAISYLEINSSPDFRIKIPNPRQ